LRRECIGGGMVVKAPANVVVLIVSAARDVVICDSTLAMKLMHVIEAAATKTASGTIVSTTKVLRNLMSVIGPKQTWASAPHMSAFGGKADMALCGEFAFAVAIGGKADIASCIAHVGL
jgi:hypothetical protein